MNVDSPYMRVGAKPIFRRGNDIGCLCLHGFSAGPSEVGWLGDHLHETMGLTVYVPRLAGHGIEPAMMHRMRWQDWYLSARDAYEVLANQCEQVFVAGLSMGGLLTLMLSAAADTDIAGAAVMAAPVFFKSRSIQYARYLRYLRQTTDMPDTSNVPQLVREEQARRGETVEGRTTYRTWSTAAIAELVDFSHLVRQALPQISTPLTLIYAEQDGAVELASSYHIAATVQSDTVEQHMLTGSGHLITQDFEREAAYALVQGFFTRLLERVTHHDERPD